MCVNLSDLRYEPHLRRKARTNLERIKFKENLLQFSQRPFVLKLVSYFYTTIILPPVLYERETCFVKLREEHRLRVSENTVQRKIRSP